MLHEPLRFQEPLPRAYQNLQQNLVPSAAWHFCLCLEAVGGILSPMEKKSIDSATEVDMLAIAGHLPSFSSSLASR